jgi:hypothetical protein
MVTRRVCGVAALLFVMLSSTTGAADRPIFCGTQRWQPLIAEAAARFGIPERWLHAVMRAESAGCAFMNDLPTTSSDGAMGLMQLMPTTWAKFRRRLALGDDPYQPNDNILAGAAYLRELYDRYGSPGLFAAYQAGPVLYENSLRGSRSLSAKTLDYIARVQRFAGLITEPVMMRPNEFGSPFVMRESTGRNSGASFDRPPGDTPFVELTHARQQLERPVGVRPDVQSQ